MMVIASQVPPQAASIKKSIVEQAVHALKAVADSLLPQKK
jgi:hypothetical protein